MHFDPGLLRWFVFLVLAICVLTGYGVGQWISLIVEDKRSWRQIVELTLGSLLLSKGVELFVNPFFGKAMIGSFAGACLAMLLGKFLRRWWLQETDVAKRSKSQFSLPQLFALLTICALAAPSLRKDRASDPFEVLAAVVVASFLGVLLYVIAQQQQSLSKMILAGWGTGLMLWIFPSALHEELLMWIPLLWSYCVGLCLSVFFDRKREQRRNEPAIE